MKRLLLILFWTCAAPAMAVADSDWDAAHQAVQENRALPLSQIVPDIESRFQARLLEAEFEDEHGVFVYELKVITEQGRIMEVQVDAGTGRLLDVEQHGNSGATE